MLTDRSFVMSIAVLSAAVGRWTRASSTIAVEVDMDVLRKHTAGTAMRDQYGQLAAERRAADSSCSNAPSYLSSKRDCKERGKGVRGDLEKARGVGVDGWTLSSVARARVT